MTTFVQLHLLTSYPPACLNRDDLNRPKTAMMGGVPRLRISSQSLKRAWRTSSCFESAFKGQHATDDGFKLDQAHTREMGVRTKMMGVKVYDHLTGGGISKKEAMEWAKIIAARFGNLKGKKLGKPLNELEIEQLVHLSPEEIEAIRGLADQLIAEKRVPRADELELLRRNHKAVDIALFGRMLANSPAFNTEAACQVAHAVTVHRAPVEDDFFTAVDDLNTREEDAGSAHMGEQGFGAGLFYLYVCIDWDLLKENLGNDEVLAKKAVRALVDAAAKVPPTGKQNSFASRAHAYYALAEKGDRQPRSLSLAFMKPVGGGDMLNDATTSLERIRDNMDSVYYGKVKGDEGSQGKEKPNSLPSMSINVLSGDGSFEALLNWIVS
jgi:CRISPR system Cascade subunit CasC